MRIQSKLEIALTVAFHVARRREHALVTVEHVLDVLLVDDDVLRVLHRAGADPAAVRDDVDRALRQLFPKPPVASSPGGPLTPLISPEMQRAIRHAVRATYDIRGELTLLDLLAALLSERTCAAAWILTRHGITRDLILSDVEGVYIMFTAHMTGTAIAGVYPADIAEARARAVMTDARGRGMALLLTVEAA